MKIVRQPPRAAEKPTPPPPAPAPPAPLPESAPPRPVTPRPAAPKPSKPQAAPTASAETAAARPRALDTAITLGNDATSGPGLAVPASPGPQGKEEARHGDPAADAAPKAKVLAASPNRAKGCDELPTKPSPVDRPRDIEYPTEARQQGIEGRLVLKITVGKDGRVTSVEVVSSVAESLDAAAIAAVKTWRFDPARLCGEAVEATYTLARRFELGD